MHKNQRVIPSLKAPHPTTVDSLLTNWSVLPIGGRQTGAIADENVTGESNVRIATSLYWKKKTFVYVTLNIAYLQHFL